MTEDEAKTKWCPMLQVSAGAGVMGTVSNRSNAYDDNSDRHGRCIGSACMAWRETPGADWASQFKALLEGDRWIQAIKLHRNYTGSSLKEAKDFVDGVRGGTQAMPQSAAQGYCGLACRP